MSLSPLEKYYEEADASFKEKGKEALTSLREYLEWYNTVKVLAENCGKSSPIPIAPLDALQSVISPLGLLPELDRQVPSEVEDVLRPHASDVDLVDLALHVAIYELQSDARRSGIVERMQRDGVQTTTSQVKHRLEKWLGRTLERMEHPVNMHMNYYFLEEHPPQLEEGFFESDGSSS